MPSLNENQLKSLKPLIIRLIRNKNDLTSYMNFINDKFDSFYNVLTSDDTKFKLNVEKRLIEIKIIDFNVDFKELYKELIKKQEEKKWLLNFSPIFDSLCDSNSSEYRNILFLKNLYSKELSECPNKELENKFKNLIEQLGFDLIDKGRYDNDFLIGFIINNDCCSNKNFKNHEKKFSILYKFKIEKMDDNFFAKFQEKKIYSFFEENLQNYIKVFCNKINYIKYFDYFFKLLPPEKYDKKTITLIYNWLLENNVNDTFSKKYFAELSYGLIDLFKIMLKKGLIQTIIELLKFFKKKMKKNHLKLLFFY